MKDKKSIGQNIDEIFNSMGKKASAGLTSFLQGWKDKQNLIPAKDPKLVEKKPRVEGKRDLYLALGLAGTILSGITTISFLFEVLTGQIRNLPYLVIFALFTLASLFLIYRSSYYKKAKIRLEKYIRALGSGTVGKLDEMARIAGVPLEVAKKDLTSFIQDNTFKEAQIVEDGQLFILDYPTYLLYKKQAQTLEKVQKEELGNPTNPDDSQGKEAFEKIKQAYPKLRQEGRDKVLPLITTIERIYKHVDQYPENKKSLTKFNSYYLPSLAGLMNRYLLLQESQDLNQSSQALGELEEAFGQMNGAFEELLDKLGGAMARDSLSEVSVLRSLMKQDGLIDRDFTLEE
ncbi:hypothetical protein HMPREF1633_04795 [Tissierellia bacterium S5-A11]|nr:hypothetical protein HMPREF1633_04795 [Tissierellia bacterium S5-A11]